MGPWLILGRVGAFRTVVWLGLTYENSPSGKRVERNLGVY